MKTLLSAALLMLFTLSSYASDFSCVGTEPFWGATVKGKFINYSDPVLESSVSLKIISKTEAAGFSPDNITVIKSKFSTLTVVRGECSDGMSDETYSHHAVFDHKGVILGGCCSIKE